ncbi:MAG TPA: carbamoyl-phosphate synthase domain-containing protein, partial [Chitinophagales bacterium]|nr:carbamoyl-phosphate synthase domain-containing protein [Chitinophagales bacterium]
MQKAILLLEDGTHFEGLACGKIGTTTGELCFTTTMTGYQEIFTDPSYNGQLLILTNVHLGNYGIKDSETESDKIQINGIICREFTNNYSRDQANSNIQNYFEANNLVGITNIDTRAIVNYIREKGTMNAILSSETDDIAVLKAKLQNVPSMEGLELASVVSTKNTYTVGDESSAKYRIAALDFGIKRNILNNFVSRNAFVKVFPANTSYTEMM